MRFADAVEVAPTNVEPRVVATVHSVMVETEDPPNDPTNIRETDEPKMGLSPELSYVYAIELLKALSNLEMLPRNKGVWIYENNLLAEMHDTSLNDQTTNVEFVSTLARLFAMNVLVRRIQPDGTTLWNLAPELAQKRKAAKRKANRSEQWLDEFIEQTLKTAVASANQANPK